MSVVAAAASKRHHGFVDPNESTTKAEPAASVPIGAKLGAKHETESEDESEELEAKRERKDELHISAFSAEEESLLPKTCGQSFPADVNRCPPGSNQPLVQDAPQDDSGILDLLSSAEDSAVAVHRSQSPAPDAPKRRRVQNGTGNHL